MNKALGDDARWDSEENGAAADVKVEPTSDVKVEPTSDVKVEPTSDVKVEPTSDVKVEPTDRWIRAMIDGTEVASSTSALLYLTYGPAVRPGSTAPELPTYFFPMADVDEAVLEPASEFADRKWWHVQVGDKRIENGAWTNAHPSGQVRETEGHITFVWDQVDEWFEEAEKVFAHARDPYHRVDALQSSRTVEVRFGEVLLARSTNPTLLFETGLPTRYYLPADDVIFAELTSSELQTQCPYKGVSRYWSMRDGDGTGENIAWSYPDPVRECPQIEGLVAFYNEKLDITVDGELQARPQTQWS